MRKGEQTRREIIRKAAPIFNQKGYNGAALSDLMRATGLEKGGIYRQFESKQELAGEAFDHAWKLAMNARFEGTQEIPNTVDQLNQIAEPVDIHGGSRTLVWRFLRSDCLPFRR